MGGEIIWFLCEMDNTQTKRKEMNAVLVEWWVITKLIRILKIKLDYFE